MCHMRPDKMPDSEGSIKRQLSSKDRPPNDTCKLPSILSRGSRVRPTHTEKVKHCTLGSRIVPPPNVPTSIDGMVAEIWRDPR